MVRSPFTVRTSLSAFLVGLALVLGLSGVTEAKDVKNDDLQATLAIILDRLDDIESKVDSLPEGLGPCDVPPVWGKTYALEDRFMPVLGGAAFCDKATGLVWEGSPAINAQPGWDFAVNHCLNRTVGGQNGFHLPLIEQLASLLPLTVNDLNSATGDGPFTGVQTGLYWSATADSIAIIFARTVNFLFGDLGVRNRGDDSLRAWCVRGGQAYDGQDVLKVLEALP